MYGSVCYEMCSQLDEDSGAQPSVHTQVHALFSLRTLFVREFSSFDSCTVSPESTFLVVPSGDVSTTLPLHSVPAGCDVPVMCCLPLLRTNDVANTRQTVNSTARMGTHGTTTMDSMQSIVMVP